MNVKKFLLRASCLMLSGVALSSNAFALKEKDITNAYPGISEEKKRNCVKFARYKTPTLPSGLSSYQDKIDNAKNRENTELPSQNWVAIEDRGTENGHVAWVKSASQDGDEITVTTHDGGWGKNYDRIYERTGTVSELKITGYFAPED